MRMDLHSYSRPDHVAVTHLVLDLELDFARREVRGVVRLDLARADQAGRAGEAYLTLDTRGLVIEAVSGSDGTPRVYAIAPDAQASSPQSLGQALRIALAPEDQAVRVRWRTTGEADALQWLEPAQTAGGVAPFLYTQGQAILTRTWIPLQDSPGVRTTWEARVRAPAGMEVVMSAERRWRDAEGAFCFAMTRAVPSYLIALAAGRLVFQELGPRCGVWAEPETLALAASEFVDTEAMIAAAEQLFGAYRWGRYDLLVLPPSFPFGGMENPCLTFATPTILAGDKSLVSLVAHELAHSWSGNLVTNATWRDFWLNEGFTVYFEHRVMEAVYGLERAQMERALSKTDLLREMRAMEARDTVLYIDLEGRHPDDGFSLVPYVKGCLFLMRLEELVGRARFDVFLRDWFDGHAFTSVTTAVLLQELRTKLLTPEEAAQFDFAAWIEGSGLPADALDPRSDAFRDVERQVAVLRQAGPASVSQLSVSGWTTHHWLHFLETMEPALTIPWMEALESRFRLTATGNSEILALWLRLGVAQGWSAIDGPLEAFLMQVGRRKFLKPLYAELAKTPAGKQRALALYHRARSRYHAVSTATLDELLGCPVQTSVK